MILEQATVCDSSHLAFFSSVLLPQISHILLLTWFTRQYRLLLEASHLAMAFPSLRPGVITEGVFSAQLINARQGFEKGLRFPLYAFFASTKVYDDPRSAEL
jgi:hypothetical protein